MKLNNTNFINDLQASCRLDNGVSTLLQFLFRQSVVTIAPPGSRSKARAPNPKELGTEKTMKQEYFVVVLAHSLRGRLRRIHIPHQAVYVILALALFGCFSVFGIVASYARMAWKVANYNALRSEADALRTSYQNLQNVVAQTKQQLASLQLYAKEVSLAFGNKPKV